MDTVFFRIILLTVGVGLQLSPTAANVALDKCKQECDTTELAQHNDLFVGDVNIYVLVSKKCYPQKIAVYDYGVTYSFYRDGEVEYVLGFNKTDDGKCMRDANGAFPIVIPPDGCDSKKLTLGFLCPTDDTTLEAFIIVKAGSKISKECADSAIEVLKNLKDPRLVPSNQEVYKCAAVDEL